MNFVCIVFEIDNEMLTLSSMENLIVPCNHIGLADFFLGQNFEIQYFCGFSEKSLFFWVVSF